MTATTDILIVGGGVIGTSIAWHLAKRQVGRVVLVEKSYLGAGSSGKSGAIVRQHYSNPLTITMARKSLKVFEQFPEIVGGPPVFTNSGLVIVVNQKDSEGLQAKVKIQKELGVTVNMLTSETLSDVDPNALLAEDEIAVHEPEAGYVESVQAVASFANAARREGADVRLGVEVKEIVREGDKVVGVETNEGRYNCGTLVLATGAWTGQLGKRLGIELPVGAYRTQVALNRRPVDFGRRLPVYGDFVQGTYFKPTHGEMIHGGVITGEEINDPVDPDNYNEGANSEWLPEFRHRLCRRYPAMHRSYGRGGYGALYGITPDWHPIIDKLPGIEGVFCAVGFSGHGFKMSPIVGELVSELVVDGEAKAADISSLRYARFAENDLVKTPYSYGVMG